MNPHIGDRVFKNQERGRYRAESLIRFTAKIIITRIEKRSTSDSLISTVNNDEIVISE